MKNLLYIVVLTFSCKLIAQDPQLFDNTWFLAELELGSEVIIPNTPSLDPLVTFNIGTNILEASDSSCIGGYGGEIESYNTTLGFTLAFFEFSPIGIDCENEDQFNFIEVHSSFYIDLPSSPPLNPFNYEITEESGIITLTITNGNNDTAIYRNVPLSLEENELDNLKVIYNAQNETLLLTGYILEPTIKVAIYNLAGQQQETSDFTNGTSINVKNLPTGIYLITLRNTNGQKVTRKFVKY